MSGISPIAHLISHVRKLFRDRTDSPKQPKNILEWLSDRGMPDSALTLLVGFLAALTLAPYLGGRTIWSVGTSAVTIPTAEEAWVRFLAFTTPFLWVLLIARLLHATFFRTVAVFLGAIAFAFSVLLVLNRHPSIFLSAITPNFNQRYELEFLKTQHTWDIAHISQTGANQYCYFHTKPQSFGNSVQPACALRIDKIEVEAIGETVLQDSSEDFDLSVYSSTHELLPEFDGCIDANNWPIIESRPAQPEVEGSAVVRVTQDAVAHTQPVQYQASFDFETGKMDAKPALSWEKKLASQDIYVESDRPAMFQVSGWTLWGTPLNVAVSSIAVRVRGRLVCGLGFY